MKKEYQAFHLNERQQKMIDMIEPGMIVEAEQGDIGEEDVSKPRVSRVIRDKDGHIGKIILKKGVVFKKEIDIPVDRILRVEKGSNGRDGRVVIDSEKKEIDSLSSTGEEQLASEREVERESGVLDTVEQAIPTAEGLREMEMGRLVPHPLKDNAEDEEQPRKSIASSIGCVCLVQAFSAEWRAMTHLPSPPMPSMGPASVSASSGSYCSQRPCIRLFYILAPNWAASPRKVWRMWCANTMGRGPQRLPLLR